MWKMLYTILCSISSLIYFLFNIFWLCFTLASVGIPWVLIFFILLFITSKFVKLKKSSTTEKSILCLFDEEYQTTTSGGDVRLFWPIANKGAAFDAPENSAAALKRCASKNCKSIFMDLSMTKCGELVILHKSTIEKANINEPIHKISYSSLENFNISEYHALAGHFQPEKILSLANLLTIMENLDVTVFLLLNNENVSNSSKCVEAICDVAKKNESFSKRIIICSSSVFTIYLLRKSCPDIICGLWQDKFHHKQTMLRKSLSSFYMSFTDTIVRNIFVPIIGISFVFIAKDEFNAHIKMLWKTVGVRPIVYSVNSPNEKRYFQKVLKTHYLTDSLRTEPQQLLIKAVS